MLILSPETFKGLANVEDFRESFATCVLLTSGRLYLLTSTQNDRFVKIFYGNLKVLTRKLKKGS